MSSLESQIVAHPFFDGLEATQVTSVIKHATITRVAARGFIFREGGDADKFYLIRRGKVVLTVFEPWKGSIAIQTLGAGEALGWSWLFPPYQWHFDARAVEDTEVIVFDAARLRTKLDDNPEIGYELLKRIARIMTERLQASRIQLLNIYDTSSRRVI